MLPGALGLGWILSWHRLELRAWQLSLMGQNGAGSCHISASVDTLLSVTTRTMVIPKIDPLSQQVSWL